MLTKNVVRKNGSFLFNIGTEEGSDFCYRQNRLTLQNRIFIGRFFFVAKQFSPPVQQPAARIVAISPDDGSAIDLRNPALAAILSWCLPGLGQLYQGRTYKGSLCMAAILATFFVGQWLGDGKVVYASWKPGETRWAFICQAGVGVVALPALIQSLQLNSAAREPLLASVFMAPPLTQGQYVTQKYADLLVQHDPDIHADDFFDKPPLRQFRTDQLSIWHHRMGKFFEIGTLYTMLAGMLNVLVIFDAWAGPLGAPTEEDRQALRGKKMA